ncbi:STAS domain-containing protein [Nocardiopsis coralliicola]
MERFRCGGPAIVQIAGEIDIATADAMRDRILAAARFRRGCVVVDLSRVDFFDASAVRGLLAAYRAVTAGGRHLVLAEPSAAARRTLDALRIGEFLDIYPIVEMALAHTAGDGRVAPGDGSVDL